MNTKTTLLLALFATSLFATGAPPRKAFKSQPPHPVAKTPSPAKVSEASLTPRTAAVLPAIAVTIDAKNIRHKIDPNIYGVAFANTSRFSDQLKDLGSTINRWGGNAVSTHNWQYNVTNRAKDYFFENIPDVDNGTAGQAADQQFINPTLLESRDALMTIPLLDKTPKQPPASGDGVLCSFDIDLHPEYLNQNCCHEFDVANRPRCGDGRSTQYDNTHFEYPRLFINDVNDDYDATTSAFQAGWIDHMVTAHGNGGAGGVKFYALDNEPSLWSFDHWDMHPTGASALEVWTKMAEYGAMIKAHDGTSLTSGVEEWGWTGYFFSGADQEALRVSNYQNHPDHDQYGDYVPWLLQQSRNYEETTGTRILDYVALHFYPQGDTPQTHFEFTNDNDQVTQLLRNRSTRSLWDPQYQDQSWIGQGPEGGIVKLIPRMREWANTNYPGTKIAVTEYSWGAEGNDTNDSTDIGFINGATAQADILGILGREGADMAVRWTAPPSTYFLSLPYKAFQMYRNYDGNRKTFGDLSLDVAVHDPNVLDPAKQDDIADDIAVFGALRSTDGAMTVMIISKTLPSAGGVTRTINLNVSDFTSSGNVQLWQLTSSNNIANIANIAFASPTTFTVPPQSITLLVIPGSYVAAPTNLVANATSAMVPLTWSGTGAKYHVYRKAGSNPAYVEITTGSCNQPTVTNCFDNAVTTGTAYLYKVQAENAGGKLSGFSNVDIATPFAFTDNLINVPPPQPVVPIKATHITELRTAIDAMRTVTGLGSFTYSDAGLGAGTNINAAQIREMRRAINQVFATLGIPQRTYVDPVVTSAVTPVTRYQIQDLRFATQ